MTETKAVMVSVLAEGVRRQAFEEASRFRGEFYECLTVRRDGLSELVDAVLCADGPVKSPVDLTLVPEHRRGHGALYGALNRGRIDVDKLRAVLADVPLPRFDGGRLVLAVDVSPWLRSDAPCSADRLFCRVYGRAKSAPLVERLVTAGQWTPGDPDITIVMDAGYDVTRLAWVLRDLPVELVGRIGGDRVMRLPKPPRVYNPKGGHPPKHGPEFRFAEPGTWPEPAITTATDTTSYGKAEAQAWDRVHPRLTHRSAWLEHDGELPIVEGTLVRLRVEHLSKEREAPPVWLWSSRTGATAADVDRWWQGFLRRFDLEHTFRFGEQTLGWTTPKLRTPAAADRWTWLLAVAHTQLRLARPLAAALRRPWGATGPTCAAHSGPGPPRVQKHPPPLALSGPCSPTTRNGPRTTARLEEPTPRHPLRRRQDRQTPREPQGHRQTWKILVDKEQARVLLRACRRRPGSRPDRRTGRRHAGTPSGGCSSTRGLYSTSWMRPSKVRCSIISRATSG